MKLLPSPEKPKQLALCLWRERRLGQTSQCLQCLPHLLQLALAAFAITEVRFEAIPYGSGQFVLEVVGDELDELLTGKFFRRRYQIVSDLSGAPRLSAPPLMDRTHRQSDSRLVYLVEL